MSPAARSSVPSLTSAIGVASAAKRLYSRILITPIARMLDMDRARNCVAAIQKRLQHRNANVQLYALTVRPNLLTSGWTTSRVGGI